MKSLIIYYSNHKGNTEKIARIFAKEIASELINIKDVNHVDLKDYNLIGFGSGVYRESMSSKVFKLVEKLNLRNKNVFIFSSSGVGLKFYNRKLLITSNNTGFRFRNAVHTFMELSRVWIRFMDFGNSNTLGKIPKREERNY